jgi:prophage regulatory protein
MGAERLLPMHEVNRATGLARSKVYAMVRRQDFPAPIKVEGRTLWIEREVQAWIRRQIETAPRLHAAA